MTANVHVLLIDDDQGTMEFLTEVLQKEGYAVDAAKTGQEALAQTRAFAFKEGALCRRGLRGAPRKPP
jgi:DNA-binding response OmpR family regulator